MKTKDSVGEIDSTKCRRDPNVRLCTQFSCGFGLIDKSHFWSRGGAFVRNSGSSEI